MGIFKIGAGGPRRQTGRMCHSRCRRNRPGTAGSNALLLLNAKEAFNLRFYD